MSEHYILSGHEAVPCDGMTWGRWFSSAREDRFVGKTTVAPGVEVSTVFLGLDHGFGGRLQIFETLVFGGATDGDMERYATWEEAEAGHAAMVRKAEAALAASFAIEAASK